MWDVLTILDTCVDLVVNLGNTRIEFDQKEKFVDSFSLEMGGSACIFACQCAKLGLSCAGIGVVGDDVFGRLVREKLVGTAVDVTHLYTDTKWKTGMGTLLNRGSDRAILTYNGTIGAVTPDMVTDDLLKNARHLHIASYYLLTGMRADMPDLAWRAKRLGLTVSLDTNWDPEEAWKLPQELLEAVDVFFPNDNEVKLLSGRTDICAAMDYFKKIPVLVVKRGKDGAIAHSNGRVYRAGAIAIPVADTVGAGDSFDAGFLYGWLHNMPIETCLRAGIYCGSMNVRANGGIASQALEDELCAWIKGEN